jgi:tRNA G18 (ribose-2'-O)-methylase SpoU
MSLTISRWFKLAHDPSYVVLDGFHALKHAIRFEAAIPLMLTDDKVGAYDLASKLAPDISARFDTDLIVLSKADLERIAPKPHPTRMTSLARRPTQSEIQSMLTRQPRVAPIILLDNPRNLGNIGAVIRLAAGFGATGVICTGTVDPWNKAVITGSAGLHFATAVTATTPDSLPEGPLFALDPEGQDLRLIDIPDDAILAFGSERHGISGEVKAKASQLLAIPMRSKVSSYNLATSVAMTLFHWASTETRQRATDDRRPKSYE